MKTKRLDFSFRPLTASCYIEVVGSIPNKQTCDFNDGSYTPDYTLPSSQLIVQLHVSVYDEDGIIPNGEVTTSQYLEIVSWKERIMQGNTSTTNNITTTTPGYTVYTTGANKGRLEMAKNVPANGRITLECNARYFDTRTSEYIDITCSLPVDCATEYSSLDISIDKPDTNIWNPFRDPQTMTFVAHVKANEAEIAVANRTLVWEKQRSDGSFSAIGTDTQDDFGWTVSSDGSTFTQQMDYIGEKMNMRVRVATLNGQAVSGSKYYKVFSIYRRLPDYDYDFIYLPDNVEPDVRLVHPEARVIDRNGIVENAEQFFNFKWYTGAGTAAGSPTMTLEAIGPHPALATSKINANGMVVGLELEDKQNYKKVVQGSSLVTVEISGVTYIVIDKAVVTT